MLSTSLYTMVILVSINSLGRLRSPRYTITWTGSLAFLEPSILNILIKKVFENRLFRRIQNQNTLNIEKPILKKPEKTSHL